MVSPSIPRNRLGYAIEAGCPSMVSLLREIGVSLLGVHRGRDEESYNDAQFAMITNSMESMVCLLNELFPSRPIEIDHETLLGLCASSSTGHDVTGILKVSKALKFDFTAFNQSLFYPRKYLGLAGVDERGGDEWEQGSLADAVLDCIQKGGNTALMRYVVKTLGLTAREKV